MRSRTVVSALALALLVSAPPAFAGQAVVAPSHAGVVTIPVTVTQLAPLACDGLDLTTIVTADSSGDAGNGNGGGNKGGGNGGGGNGGGGNGGGGNGGGANATTVQGTDGNDLLLGTPGPDLLQGRRGTDCLVGGGGADSLDGGQDTDVCITGSPDDTTARCETVL